MRDDPVVIGGTGGSGTRVVARMLRTAGVFMGGRLSPADDALELVEFDRTWGLEFQRDGATDEMRAAFDAAMERHLAPLPGAEGPWGWKLPQAYLLLPFLAERFPRLRFVHVIRDGRDLTGAGEGAAEGSDPARRLRFWARANGLAADQGAELLGDRYLLVRYEDLCARPRKLARRMIRFADAGAEHAGAAAAVVAPPPAPVHAGESEPDEVVAEALRRFGYEVEGAAPVEPAAVEEPPTAEPEPEPEPEPAEPATPADALRAQLGPPPTRDRWPLVSAVVPTRDGRALLERLVAGLTETTDYPELELIVVDNGSTDGTLEWLAGLDLPFPLLLVDNGRNLSFSASCNRGAQVARGDLLLFLNNDVEPIEDGWLRRLTGALEASGAAAAGATLVDPAEDAVQHRHVVFEPAGEALKPALAGRGDPAAQAAGPDRSVAAVAAACALIRRPAFEAVGGFDEGYFYGGEDVDLCLTLLSAGHRVLAAGSTVLLHRPMSTRRGAEDVGRDQLQRNHRRLLERWGPALRREYAEDVQAGRGAWSRAETTTAAPSSGLTYRVLPGDEDLGPNADRLARRLRRLGREATAGPGEGDGWLLDDVVIHLDRGIRRRALVPGRLNVLVHLTGPRPPVRERALYDLVLLDRPQAEELVAAVEAELTARGGPRRVAATVAGPPPAHAPSAPRAGATLVLGMSRTGTSATARLLNLSGIELGEADRLLGPIEGVNDKGFFEHYPIMRLNTELLRRLGGSWKTPPDLAPGWEDDPALDDLRERARELIDEDFADTPRWGFKDPRLCLTLPFWRPLLRDPAFVICHRNPLDVAASLAKRDGLSQADAVALWARNTAGAVAHTHGAPRMFIGYDEYFAAPDEALAALTAFSGQPELATDPAFRREADAWLEPGLRHHAATLADVAGDPELDEPTRRLHLLLELAIRSRRHEPALAGAGGSGPVSDALDALAREILAGAHSGSRA